MIYTTLREAAQQALAFIRWTQFGECRTAGWDGPPPTATETEAALRAALAQPAPEPVAYIHRQGNHWEVSERFLFDDEKARGWTEEPLYTASPQRLPLPRPIHECYGDCPTDPSTCANTCNFEGRVKPVQTNTCTWWQDGDSDSGAYQTSCGNYFAITDGTPEDNMMRHCCYCGKKLVQELITEDTDE